MHEALPRRLSRRGFSLSRVATPLVIATILLTGPGFAPVATRAQSRSPQSALHDTLLDNGMEVVVVENHTVPLATVVVSVRSGALIQGPGQEGLAHLFEHVLFRIYDGDPAAFPTEAAKLNAAYNGVTRQEDVAYFLMLPSENVNRGIELLAGLITRARFPDDAVDAVRPVVLDELARSEADPEQALVRRVAQRIWGNAWYARDVGGDSITLRGISTDHLRDAYERYYTPDNAVLVVTGDVQRDGVFEEAQRRFGSWTGRTPPETARPVPPSPSLLSTTAVLLAGNVWDVTLHIAFSGPDLRTDTADTYATSALTEYLNDPTSPLQEYLLAEGLFQSIQFEYVPRDGPALITVTARAAQTTAQRALPALIEVLDGLDTFLEIALAEGVSGAQFVSGAVQKRRAVDAALILEHAATLATTLASWWARGGIDYHLSWGQETDAQTPEQLQRAARRYIVNQPKVIGVLASPAMINRIAAQLGSGRPPQ